MSAVLIVHPFKGIYLGPDQRRVGIWSRLDPRSCVAALAFGDEKEAETHMGHWPGGRPRTARLVPITPDIEHGDCLYASERACRMAGIGSWINMVTPVEGGEQ